MSRSPPIPRLLQLEDSLRDAQLIHDTLELEGLVCDIRHVSNREDFESAVAEEPFDIILADYNIPGYDGMSALKLARKKCPETPVIVISGDLGEEEAVRCLKLGATDYLLKQRLGRLPNAVRQALASAEEEEERKAANERIREQAELLDKARDAIFVKNSDGRITFWNKGAERLYGWTAAEAVGQNAGLLFLGKSGLGTPEAVEALLEVDEWTGEVLHKTKTGESVTVESRLTLIRDHEGHPKSTLAINTDISEKKQLALNLLRTQRLESIGTLAGGIAHDLNNALAPILMATGLLKNKHPDSIGMLNTMEKSAVRGAEMVRQLLTFAKGSGGGEENRVSVQPLYLLQEVEKIIGSTFPKNISLQTEFAPGLQMIRGNATQLHQVLLNLCVNARDAMPDGGTLKLAAEPAQIGETYLSKPPEATAGSYIVWRITDTGTGISPEIRERIFEPFFSTKSTANGTGLGLSTLIGIVKSHGGFVEVDSEIGRGSTFSIFFPALPCQTKGGNLSVPGKTKYRGRGELILLVDDEAAVREVAKEILTDLNFNVITAQGGEEALAQVVEHRSQLAVLITDLHMPHMDGLDLARTVRGMLPTLAIVVATGHLQEGEMEALNELRPLLILDKPFTQKCLSDAVQNLLQYGSS